MNDYLCHKINDMDQTFIFPDGLQDITLDRLTIDLAQVDTFKAGLDTTYRDRITDIDIKCKAGESWTMRFTLDDRRSGKCDISADKQAWLDAGLVSLVELAMSFCKGIKPGVSRKAVQRSLFD